MQLRMIVSILAATLAGAASAETLIVANVRGYTPTRTGIETFSALVIRDGKIERLLKTSPDSELARGAQLIDGAGRTLLPGLTDAHGHVLSLGQQSLEVELRGTASIGEAVGQVRKYAQANRSSSWLMGRGWNQVLWEEQRFPTAAELDAAIADRPAALSRVDGHAMWVNSAALELAGITAKTHDPPGGQVVRDANGKPTGVLIDAAMALVERHIPPHSDADMKRALQAAMRELVSLGLTGVHDAGIDARQYRAYEELGASGDLPMRVYAMLADSKEARGIIESGPRPAQFDDRLQMRAIKAWIDGALGSRGAALMEDYSDQHGHRGLHLYTREQLGELVKLGGAKGWQLSIHAIGDDGNRIVLDTFEKLLSREQRHALRPRIEHAQIVALDDIPRFARLDVIASIQPTHATSDMNMAETRVGPARIKGAYAWRKLLDNKARLAGGSDFPVELANPFYGLYAAVTRQDRDGRPPGGWYPQERLTREEALRLFTLDAAYAGHMEQATGSLEPGKWADFILIDRDYFKVPESEIDDIRVVATYVAGKKVTK